MTTSRRPDDWRVYQGTGEPHDRILQLPEAPPWRRFSASSDGPRGADTSWRGAVYQASPEIVEIVNAALYLRRPLLVTGPPGSGKSSIPFHVARELGLGGVLSWPITSRSALRDGLYSYDALGRLHDANLGRDRPADVGRYLQLGPLGTALLPNRVPRVLLIDEIDKSDVDLPNDLLNIIEEGEFVIPELARLAETEAQVRVYDATGDTVILERGRVRAREFPFTVMTSNGERDFPPAFLRRCLRIDLAQPNADELVRIVEAHLGPTAAEHAEQLVEEFIRRRSHGALSTDQLLNAVYLATRGGQRGDDPEAAGRMQDTVFRPLN